MNDDYMCPFCVTPWKCNGPHINQDDMPNFESYINECENKMLDAACKAVEDVMQWPSNWDRTLGATDALNAIEALRNKS